MKARLETVREIKEGMGVHSPRIEELAERKLRIHEPALAEEWDGELEANRRHQALIRKQKNVKKRSLSHSENIGSGLSLTLSTNSCNFSLTPE